MGIFDIFKKKKETKGQNAAAAPFGEPNEKEWPDLTGYRKGILLHNGDFQSIAGQLAEYAEIYADAKEVTCDFTYTALPGDESWIYLEFPSLGDASNATSFWVYLNLMVWLGEGSDREFCLALPDGQNGNAPVFFSMPDRENPDGDSCIGFYGNRRYNFIIPASLLTWREKEKLDLREFLLKEFQFDMEWIAGVSQGKWMTTQVTLAVPEE